MSEAASRWGSALDWSNADAGAFHSAPQDVVVDGRCTLCDAAIHEETAGKAMDFREGLVCPRCRCNARQRAAAIVLFEALDGRADAHAYATEQATPFYTALKRRMSHLSGSEYVREWRRRLRLSTYLWRNGVRELVRFADLTALQRRDASLDAIVSLDVLEHLPDHRPALRECARVLRPGGTLLVTVPFVPAFAQSRRLARMRDDGTIEHFAEPEYHGDPVSGGVLCFQHFGWDLLDDMRDAGFVEARARLVFAPEAGIPESQWVLVGRR